MSVQSPNMLSTVNAGFSPENVQVPIIQQRAPTSSDVNYPIGKRWVDEVGAAEYSLVQLSSIGGSLQATWTLLSSGSSVLDSLQGDAGGPVSPTAGLISILGAGGLTVTGNPGSSTLTISNDAEAGFPITPFVVGPVNKAGFQSIASAIAAASSAGGGTVYIQQGTYTENLTMVSGVNLVGVPGSLSGSVIIVGVHTPPASGSLVCQNIKFESANHVFSSGASGTTSITVQDCTFDINGAIFNLSSWTSGTMKVINCAEDGSTSNTIAVVGGTTNVVVKECFGLGTGATCTYAASGIFSLFNSKVTCSFVLSESNIENNDIVGSISISANGSGRIVGNYITSGSTSCITFATSTSYTVVDNFLDSSNAAIIAGSGSNVFNNNTINDVGTISFADTFYTPTTLAGIQALQKPTTTNALDAWCGSVTLVGGTATVSTLAVFTGSLIGLSRLSIGATGAAPLGLLTVGTIIDGTSFVIRSVLESNATALQTADVSVVFWWIIN